MEREGDEVNINSSLPIDGWMNVAELSWLARRASQAQTTLEVGVWKARSTRTLGLNTRGRVVGLDPWAPYGELDANDEVYTEAKRNVADLPNVTLVRGSVDTMPAQPFDFIFIDGCHEYEAVKRDILVGLSLLTPNGIISGHDYWHEGVRRAVHEFFPTVDTPAGGIWSVQPDAQRVAWAQSAVSQEGALRCFDAALEELGTPKCLLDVGCGDGFLVRAAQAKGINAWGVDLYYEGGTDLTQFWTSGFMYDWVICWEVAEHLPPISGPVLVHTIDRAAHDKVLFCAAIPGQGGSGHLNERPATYWAELFEARGLRRNGVLSDVMRERFMIVAPQQWWYGQNIQVFDRCH